MKKTKTISKHPAHDDIMERWNKEARQRLLNRRIVEARYLTRQECKQLGWTKSGVTLEFDDGTWFYAACDDEGNNAGALHGVSGNDEQIAFPVMDIDDCEDEYEGDDE